MIKLRSSERSFISYVQGESRALGGGHVTLNLLQSHTGGLCPSLVILPADNTVEVCTDCCTEEGTDNSFTKC